MGKQNVVYAYNAILFRNIKKEGFQKQTNKQTRDQSCGYWGWGNWMNMIKKYRLPVIRQINTRFVM